MFIQLIHIRVFDETINHGACLLTVRGLQLNKVLMPNLKNQKDY